MAHFNFVISQNAKWGHAGFYIDCDRMMVPENILLQKKHWPGERLYERTVKHVKCTEDAMDHSKWKKLIRMSDDQDGCEWVSISSGTGLPGKSRTKDH